MSNSLAVLLRQKHHVSDIGVRSIGLEVLRFVLLWRVPPAFRRNHLAENGLPARTPLSKRAAKFVNEENGVPSISDVPQTTPEVTRMHI